MSNARFATVTSVGPLRVRLDGEAAPLAVDPINLAGPLAVGDRVWSEHHDKGLFLVGSVTRPDRDLLLLNAQRLFNGGGIRTATSTGVAWSQRFLMSGMHLGPLALNGYFAVTMPPNGTAIPVEGSGTTVTVSGGIVPLAAWQVLWYEPPLGSTFDTVAGNFHITVYTSPVEVPPSWLPVVARQNDRNAYVWGDGRETGIWTNLTLSNGWIPYDSGPPGYYLPQYKVENGLTYMHGMVKSGTATGISTLPVGARPAGAHIFTQETSPNVLVRINVSAAGVLSADGYNAGWVSLSIPPFHAEA